MKKILFVITAALMLSSAIFADDDKERHYRPSTQRPSTSNRPSSNNNHHSNSSNYNKTVTFYADQYKSSRFIDVIRGRHNRNIAGKLSSYNRYGEAHGAKLIWPMAEYNINSRERGGEYTITVHYKTNKRIIPRNPYIMVGMNSQNAVSLPVKKSSGSVKTSFRTNYNYSGNHNLKIWLPSAGVEIEKIEVRRRDSGGRR